MASLGTFGAVVREYEPPTDPDTFELCGGTFRVVGEIPGMVELKLGAALTGKIGGLEGDAALYEALRHALTVPEREADGKTVGADASEWDRFYEVATTKGAAGEWLTALVLNILAAQVGRPTVRPSTSSDGRSTTSTNSSASSSDSPALPDSTQDDPVSAG